MAKLYQEILEYMDQKISAGEWPIGFKLPREIDLCEQFHISRTTLRRALAILSDKGRLQRIKGTGTFVIEPKIIESITLFIDSFAEELKERGQAVVTQVLEFHPITASSNIAACMGIKENEPLIKLRRLRFAAEHFEEGPVVLTTSYFPYDIGQILMKYNMEKESVRQLCRKNGIMRDHNTKQISAVHLPQLECRLLGSADNDIFLSIHTRIYDASHRCIEYVESYYPVDRNEFSITTVSHPAKG